MFEKDDSSQPLWLLLLPTPPRRHTLSTLRAAYGPCLTEILLRASSISSSSSAITLLDIAISTPQLDSSENVENDYFQRAQNLIGQVYRLICVICVEQKIDIQYGNDVDARILLFHDIDDPLSELSGSSADRTFSNGPIISLQALASCDRSWQRLCSTDSETGGGLLKNFLRSRSTRTGEEVLKGLIVERYPDGQVSDSSDSSLLENDVPNKAPLHYHGSVALGGTFDHLHAGHKLLLTMAAFVLHQDDSPEKVRTLAIGITGDELLKKKQFREHLEDWHQRQAAVEKFILSLLVLRSPSEISTTTQVCPDDQGKIIYNKLSSGLIIKYVELFDAFGPTLTEESISALIVSGETREGGKAINKKRTEKGWPSLEVFEVDILDVGEDDGKRTSQGGQGFEEKISSTEIRRRLYEKFSGANG
ncbi:MAG: hypothetical protein LQ342_005745 [Letrouitia transgressa]|nr:MAG: hypothetical protein LQ342_005745 [Letrouitia transgressa]